MKLSVIVCTFNRAYAIGPCLDSIAASLSAAAPVDAEIVVVNNASTDDTAAVVEEWAKTCPYPVCLVLEPKQGVSCARNCGLRTATGELLIYVDDDCRLSRNHITEALRYASADTRPVLRGGRVDHGNPDSDLPITIKTLPHVARWHIETDPVGDAWLGDNILGCNMVMTRKTANIIGYFDENLGTGTRIPAGEESDYTFRAYFSGVLIEYVPDMAVSHHHGRKEIKQGQTLVHRYAVGTGALYMKYLFTHPELLRQLYRDSRQALREILTGENRFMPFINFGHKDWVAGCILGMLKYIVNLPIKKET